MFVLRFFNEQYHINNFDYLRIIEGKVHFMINFWVSNAQIPNVASKFMNGMIDTGLCRSVFKYLRLCILFRVS